MRQRTDCHSSTRDFRRAGSIRCLPPGKTVSRERMSSRLPKALADPGVASLIEPSHVSRIEKEQPAFFVVYGGQAPAACHVGRQGRGATGSKFQIGLIDAVRIERRKPVHDLKAAVVELEAQQGIAVIVATGVALKLPSAAAR